MLLFNCSAALHRAARAGASGLLIALAAVGAHAAGTRPDDSAPPARIMAAVTRGPLLFDRVGAADAHVAATLPAWLGFRSAALLDWSADGRLLAGVAGGGNEQLYRIRSAAPAAAAPSGPADDPAAEALPVPKGTGRVVTAAAHPYDANRLLLQVRGSTGSQLLLDTVDTGTVTPLDARALADSPVLWAHDGKRIAFASSARNGRDVDVYTLDTTSAGAQPRLVAGAVADDAATGNDAGSADPADTGAGDDDSDRGKNAGASGTRRSTSHWQLLDWSPDDNQLLLRRELAANSGLLYLADLRTGRVQALDRDDAVPARPLRGRSARPTAGQAPVRARSARFAAGGGIVYLGYGDGDHLRVRWLDPVTGDSHVLSPDLPYDVRQFDLSADGRYLAYVYDVDGLSRVVLLDLRSLTPAPTPRVPVGLPAGIIRALRFDRTGQRLALQLDATRLPGAVYVFDLRTQRTSHWSAPQPVTAADPGQFTVPALLRFSTWDTGHDGRPRQLSAYVYRAAGLSPHPVLVWLHDGPFETFRPGFHALLQYYVRQLGYTVIAPDVRGSAGYGRAFAALGEGPLRADAARDLGALLVWIGVQPDLDARRVAVLGQGYGGYLALMALAQYDTRLAGGVDIAGPSDLATWLDGTAMPGRDLLRAQFGDERDIDVRAFLHSISPLARARAIHKPLLIVHGLDNSEVAVSESTQLLAGLRASRADVGYLAVADAGRDLDRSAGREQVYATIAGFLARLAAAPAATAAAPGTPGDSSAVADRISTLAAPTAP